MDAKLEAVPLVDIDNEGRFKYILIKVYGREQADGTEPTKLIVRGYKRAEWHGNFKIQINLSYSLIHIHNHDNNAMNLFLICLQLTFMMRLVVRCVHLA